MATIFRRGPGIGASLGQSLGTGLGGALQGAGEGFLAKKMQGLAQQKQQQEQAKIMAALQSLGLPGAVASLPPQTQQEIIKNWAAEGGLEQLLSGMGTQPGPRQAPIGQPTDQLQNIVQQLEAIRDYQAPRGPQIGMQNLQDILNQYASPAQAMIEGIQKQQTRAQSSQQPIQEIPRTRQALQAQTSSMQQMEPHEILQRKPIGKSQRELYKEARKDQLQIDKELNPYVEIVSKKGGPNAKKYIATLDRMEKLIDSGKLTGPTMYNIRKRIDENGPQLFGALGGALGGLVGGAAGTSLPGVGTVGGALGGAAVGSKVGSGLGGLLIPKFVGSKEDQEFGKLVFNFLDGLKDVFGGRITNTELQNYLQSLPSLGQSDEGKKAVIRDMRLLTQAWQKKKDILDQIIAENGGYKPRNLELLVEQRSKPYTDQIFGEFVSGLEKLL